MALIDEDLGQKELERSVDRSELYAVDEILLCATAAMVVPVVGVDGRSIGAGTPGERTLKLQRTLLEIASREDPRHEEWTTLVSTTLVPHNRSFY